MHNGNKIMIIILIIHEKAEKQTIQIDSETTKKDNETQTFFQFNSCLQENLN
jgi:hypothetical protein